MVTYFVVTGFGKFAGMDDNPSQALVQALQGYLKERGKGVAGAHALVPLARLPAHLQLVLTPKGARPAGRQEGRSCWSAVC